MTDPMSKALEYSQDHRPQFVERLGDWLTIPSVSTQTDHRADMERAAAWIADTLRDLGLGGVQLFPPESHPIVYAEKMDAGPGAPTVLLYGHYDVQPAEPFELWDSEPFKPTVRGEDLYARGACDMKGQIFSIVCALESILAGSRLPVNVRFMIEGGEEIGSPHLPDFITRNRDLLTCDFCLNPDTGMLAPDLPSITIAMRGIAYFEVRVYGPSKDLHSGAFGGVVHNPAQVLCDLVAGMHDENGRITLPGFYDKVRELAPDERAELARVPVDEASFLEQTGAPALWGEAGYSQVERIGIRPTLEVNGLCSGFTGEGAKTVLPAHAMAKISMRLVPDQDSAAIKGQLEAYLDANAPSTVRWELDEIAHIPATLSERHSPWIEAMTAAQREVWGRSPVFTRGGGGVPVVIHLQQILGMESVNIGWALPDGNPHAPNERLHLPAFYKGIETLIRYLYKLAEVAR
ncbi:MAG: dipeptidase [bacterium]|nr:dipeptidase [bacterium]